MNRQRKAVVCEWVLVLLASVLWCNMDLAVALADGMILPETLGSGYLGVRYHHVTVSIEDNHAVTRVEQEFYNPYDFLAVGQYLFPVPPEAILSSFRAIVNGEEQSVVRQDAATTNALLFANVAEQQDPSLLQYVDWESLTFNVSLAPGESCHVVLEYEEVLAPVGGMYRYRYILSTERYSLQPLEQVSLTIDVTSSSGLANVYSSSHPVIIEEMGKGRARASWEAQDVLPTDDFELFFAPAGGGFGGGLLTGQRNGHDHFLFLFAPEAEPARGDSLPKDIVFVMDRSGSMSGEKIEQARNALHFILGQLGDDDRFSIVGFDDRLKIFAHALQPVDAYTLADARRFVDLLTADGNTDLDAALQAGLDIMASSERHEAARIVVFLTDGLPTAGVTDETLIAQRATQANAQLKSRLHVFGVGYDVNTHLLDPLAADNGGTVTYVQPGENLETVLTEFYAHIAHPVLTDVEVEFEGLEVSDLYPQAVPDLFQGSSLLLTGRYRATADTAAIRVRGRTGAREREYVYQFDLSRASGHDFVPRLWATRRVGDLLDQVRVDGESQILVKEIRELGLDYGLVTPYTTFVIEGRADGAASAVNMTLYRNQAELNQASGQITIQARVQNQAYQQATQANLAAGANIANYGQHSLAQASNLNVDLSLLKEQEDVNGPITTEWVESNIGIDRTIVFGSKEYFALAADPTIRVFLQSGLNVVFGQGGEVILVQDAEAPKDDPVIEQATGIQSSKGTLSNRGTWQASARRASQQSENTAVPTADRMWSSAPLFLALVGVLAAIAILLKAWQALYCRESIRRQEYD